MKLNTADRRALQAALPAWTVCRADAQQALLMRSGIRVTVYATGVVVINGSVPQTTGHVTSFEALAAFVNGLKWTPAPRIVSGPDAQRPLRGHAFSKWVEAMCAVDVLEEELEGELRARGFIPGKNPGLTDVAKAEAYIRATKAKFILDEAVARAGGGGES